MEDRRSFALWRFTTEKRQTEEILSGVTAYKVSFNGEKLFYARGRTIGFSRRSPI